VYFQQLKASSSFDIADYRDHVQHS